MIRIQTLNDIEVLEATRVISLELIKEIEKDFLDIYESNNDEVYLMNFRLPIRQALFVLEKGDNVLAELDDPFTLEYVEKIQLKKWNITDVLYEMVMTFKSIILLSICMTREQKDGCRNKLNGMKGLVISMFESNKPFYMTRAVAEELSHEHQQFILQYIYENHEQLTDYFQIFEFYIENGKQWLIQRQEQPNRETTIFVPVKKCSPIKRKVWAIDSGQEGVTILYSEDY